ncbi:hypothetical protein N0V83_001594 [Neocucurbitaria cava]|uniref:DUF427 domain-containing protein n=1 Tax=Neocucurbitaria cava TaxID=798079 RepID=A0A9W9CQJ5_9PLEO|nr:hypothetical protein N0V83_001594 [Neocucurbitaria cava]
MIMQSEHEKRSAEHEKRRAEYEKQRAEYEKRSAEITKRTAEITKRTVELKKQIAERNARIAARISNIDRKLEHLKLISKLRLETEKAKTELAKRNADTCLKIMANTSEYYVPISSFSSDITLTKLSPVDGTNGGAHLGKLTVANRSTDRVLIFNTKTLQDLVKVEFGAIDQWFEEEVPIYCHPKDPYKRIDILQSTRTVKIALDGITLAESSSPLLLLETTLRTRYYVPPTSIAWQFLTPSDTETLCPYKGRANYYHVNVNGKLYKDVVWYYRYPTAESAPIAGHICFYNEKVDVWVDGEKESKQG